MQQVAEDGEPKFDSLADKQNGGRLWDTSRSFRASSRFVNVVETHQISACVF